MSSVNKNLILSFVVILVTSLIVAGAVVLKPEDNTPAAQPRTTSGSAGSSASGAGSATADSSTNTPNGTAHYKDGTYNVTASYDTPEGIESMGVSITVANDTVTKTTASVQSRGRESRAYQQDFVGSYQSAVVGKPLSSLNLRIVAGASLTTAGFNDALDIIRTQAKA